MAYPTVQDFNNFLLNCGFEDLPLDAQSLLNVAIQKFETKTGWGPFLATSTTRVFEIPDRATSDGYRLDLIDFPYLSLSSVQVRRKDNSVRTLAHLTEYRRLPLSSGQDFSPFFALRLEQAFEGIQLELTGSFGFTSTIPVDVKDCILKLAAQELALNSSYPALVQTGGREMKRTRVGTTEIEYAEINSKWEKDIDETIKEYMKWV